MQVLKELLRKRATQEDLGWTQARGVMAEVKGRELLKEQARDLLKKGDTTSIQ